MTFVTAAIRCCAVSRADELVDFSPGSLRRCSSLMSNILGRFGSTASLGCTRVMERKRLANFLFDQINNPR